MARKFIAILVVMLIALTAFAPALSFAAAYPVGEAARVSTPKPYGKVNLRRSAGMSGKVIKTLPDKNPLAIQGRRGNWYKVRDLHTAATGYMHKNYVAKTFIGTVSGNVNLRRGAGTKYGVIRVVEKGSEVTVVQLGKTFSKVRRGASTGWISNRYLTYKALGC